MIKKVKDTVSWENAISDVNSQELHKRIAKNKSKRV